MQEFRLPRLKGEANPRILAPISSYATGLKERVGVRLFSRQRSVNHDETASVLAAFLQRGPGSDIAGWTGAPRTGERLCGRRRSVVPGSGRDRGAGLQGWGAASTGAADLSASWLQLDPPAAVSHADRVAEQP